MGQVSKKNSGATELVGLLPEQVRRLPKARDGFAQYADELIELYAQNPDELRVKGKTPEMLADELRMYEALLDSEATARKQLDLVAETRALHGANVWLGMLGIYARAKAAARDDVAMQHAIAAFERFMKTGPRRKDVTPPVTPTTPTT